MNTAALTINQGEDWVTQISYLQSGVPTAVTDIHAQIKKLPNDSEPVLDLNEGDEITHLAPGVVQIVIPKTVTVGLPVGYGYQWDLFGTVNGRRIKLIETSSVDILSSVTRD